MTNEEYKLWTPIQIYYNLSVCTDENFDELSIEEQRKILPDLLAWYSFTWFAKNFPHNEEDLPYGVKPSKHFISFDKENGLSLCVEYLIDENIVLDTEKFKKILQEITEDAEGQFSDGWGESFEQHSFKIGEQEYYPKADSDIFWIVASVGLNDSLLVRWKSIDEIEHVDWMLAYDNDAINMLFHEEQHKKRIEREMKIADMLKDTYTIDKLKFVETQQDKFFIAWQYRVYCQRFDCIDQFTGISCETCQFFDRTPENIKSVRSARKYQIKEIQKKQNKNKERVLIIKQKPIEYGTNMLNNRRKTKKRNIYLQQMNTQNISD